MLAQIHHGWSTTQTCPNNIFNLTQDKQDAANLYTKDTKLNTLAWQIQENTKVLHLAGLYSACDYLSL